MNQDFYRALKTRNIALARLAEATRKFADANGRASRVYSGLTLNEESALSNLRLRLREFDEAQTELRVRAAA